MVWLTGFFQKTNLKSQNRKGAASVLFAVA